MAGFELAVWYGLSKYMLEACWELSVLGWRVAPWCDGAEYLFSATGALCLDMQRQAYGRSDD